MSSQAIVGATALVLLMSGCGAGATSEGEGDDSRLVIYSAEEAVDFFAERYEEENQGVSIDVLKGSSGESTARVVAEAGRPRGDILVAGGDPAATHPELFSDNGDIDQSAVAGELKDPDGVFAPIVTFPVIFVYNEERLEGDAAPTTWQELADPRWKDRIQMGNPGTSEAAYKAMATWWSIGGWDLVEAIAENAIITEGSTDAMQAVGNGETAIGIGVEQQVYKWENGDTVKAGYPTDGIILHPQPWYQIADSPNPEAAADFINYMLEPDTQSLMSKEFPGMRPVVDGVEIPDSLPAIDELNILPFPAEGEEDREEWNSIWEEIMTSKG